ncbi:MAG: DNA polymerase III subunit gamma/tau [Candidatus Melainabacteria bacterium]|nr:DNA polymerase III subunit gamma/tau [Candidatus Melainabacteria bacterium]
MKQYQPLYLKYRPQKLFEIIGQEFVRKTLSNAILYNKIVHAYLFCGPRGTGKTSTARILAKSLNCMSGITLEPCDKCLSCKSIIQGNSLDVIEIDAASHRKVEDAEDLINRVGLVTYGSRFKIYIIDEVHMLTDHAFNALLKTIEEPPKNVIFILATTEEYKVIPTIISRCQKFDFKPASIIETESKIKAITKEEKINIDQNIINFISKKSLGCLRDAISLLDQISVLQDDDRPIDSKEVFKLLGTVERSALFTLMEAILTFNKKRVIDLAEELIKTGKDISEIFKDLLELIIDLAKAKIDPECRNELSKELSNDLNVLEKVKQGHLLKIIDKLQDALTKLRFALSQELQFMVEIMSMLDEDFLVSMTELKERIEKLENLETLKPQNLETSKPQNLETSKPQNLETSWKQAISLIDSNPTKTLLNQSESYLISLSSELAEIGLSRDMFLPRLEQDTKKKEMIIRAIKLSTNIEPKVIRFKVEPHAQISETSKLQNLETLKPRNLETSNDDELSRSIKDLLGAKQIE